MTQTTVEWENLIRKSPKWSCNGRQQWFMNFLLEVPFVKVNFFPLHLFKPLGWFFLVVSVDNVHKVNYLTR
jgi:hypothetical protein